MQTEALMEKQRSFFDSGKTLDISFRVRALDRLEQSLLACEDRLYAALRKDLGKSRAEAYMCEIGLTLSELRYMKNMCVPSAGAAGSERRWHSFMRKVLPYRSLMEWY